MLPGHVVRGRKTLHWKFHERLRNARKSRDPNRCRLVSGGGHGRGSVALMGIGNVQATDEHGRATGCGPGGSGVAGFRAG